MAAANIWIAFWFITWTLFCLPFGYLVAFAHACTGWKCWREMARRGTVFYGTVQIRLFWPFIRVETENAELPRLHSPSIIVSNHKSFLDIFLIEAQRQSNICLTSKSWPYRLLFFFAPVMRAAGYVDVENLQPEEAGKRCMERLDEGATLVMFPEGRRTRVGKLGRFHAGAFRLACKAGVPVIPMLFMDSCDIFPVGAKFFTPGTIHIRLLPPVYPGSFTGLLPHREMMRHVQQLFRHNLV